MATQTIPSPATPSFATASQSNLDMIRAASEEPVQEPSQASTETPETPTETPEVPSSTETSEQPVEATPDEGTSEQPTDATVPDAEENPYDSYQDETQDFAPQTLDAVLKTPEGKKMYANHKLVRELSKPIEQGGLGFTPSVAELREHYGAYRDMRLIENDLLSGDPQGAERLIGHMFGTQRGASAENIASQLVPTLARVNPRVLEQMAPTFAQTLAQISPQAYATAAEPIMSAYSTRLWDRWAELPGGPEGSPQQKIKDVLGYAAQVLQKDLTGKYRTDVADGPQQVQNQPDPYAERAQELTQREQQIAQWQHQQGVQQERQWNTELGKSIQTNLMSELDIALKPLKDLYKDKPGKYDRLRKEFHDGLISEVPKNRHAWDIYQAQLGEAKRARNPEQLQAVAREYVKLAKPIIAARRKAFLEEEGAAVKAANDARHAELRQTEQHRAPSGNGAAPRPGSGPPITRNPGETSAEFNLRQLKAALR